MFVAEEGERPSPIAQNLVGLYFRDQVENGTAAVETLSLDDLQLAIDRESRASRCTCLILSDVIDEALSAYATIDRLAVTPGALTLNLARRAALTFAGVAHDLFAAWTDAYAALLREWAGEG